MKIVVALLITFSSCFLFALHLTQAQDKSAESKKNKKQTITQKQNTDIEEVWREAEFRSPFRYVIVYNELSETSIPGRSLEVLMDEKAFNEENLKQLFELLDKRFSKPERLTINVRTSLDTIETPEEKEKGHFQHEAGRLTDEIKKHKDAFYIRYQNGYRRFAYTISLNPKYDKNVELTNP